jgi:hypothetical protein
VDEPLPVEFWQGIEQFNQREFYACHDTLEAIWMEAAEPQRTLYQGILQIAVALYHLSNQNGRGAVILLGEGMNRLRPYAEEFVAVDLSPLLNQCLRLQQVIYETPADGLERLWHGLLNGYETHGEELENLSLPIIRRGEP